MTNINVIRRHYDSGRCKQCHSKMKQNTGRLCPQCDAYANQDYGSQRDFLVSFASVIQIADDRQDLWVIPKEFELQSAPDKPQRWFKTILHRAGLTRREREIAFFTFLEGRSQRDAAKLLGITQGCLFVYISRIRKKLQLCMSRALLSKGEQSTGLQNEPVGRSSTLDIPVWRQEAENAIRKTRRDWRDVSAAPNPERPEGARRHISLRHTCPRCGDAVFRAHQDYHYCMNCLWNSD